MKIGNHIREKKKAKEENKRKVQSVKNMRSNEQMSVPLGTKVYGGLQFDMDNSTQQSSHPANPMSQFSDAKTFKKG